MKQLIPEWTKPKRLYLVYPEAVSNAYENYDSLKTFFTDALLPAIPENIPLTVLVRKEEFGRKLKELRPDMDFQVHPELNYIYLRDYAGFMVSDDGFSCYVSPFFCPPDYLLTFNDAMPCNTIGAHLTGKKPAVLELFFDGGNLVHNGRGTAIIDRYLLKRNYRLGKVKKSEIERLLEAELGITNPVFIDSAEYDCVHHADGSFVFLNSQTVLADRCPEHDSYYEVWEKIIRKLEKSFKVLFFENFDPKIANKDSLEGSYLNFLRLGSDFLLPQFKSDKDNKVFHRNAALLEPYGKVIPVPRCEEPAAFGGLLHCLSFVEF